MLPGAGGFTIPANNDRLQVVCGMEPPGIFIPGDVNNDGKIGLEEAIFVLQLLSETRRLVQ